MTRLSFFLAAACIAAPGGLHAQQRPSPIPEAELVRRLGATLDSLSAAGQFSGVVVLARQGQPVFQHAYGFADREARRRNQVETAFNLGSINKVFTQTAIRQLAAAGKLELDSTAGGGSRKLTVVRLGAEATRIVAASLQLPRFLTFR